MSGTDQWWKKVSISVGRYLFFENNTKFVNFETVNKTVAMSLIILYNHTVLDTNDLYIVLEKQIPTVNKNLYFP